MLGISLIFVGITLFMNGLVEMNNWKKKSLILLNLLTGGIIFIFNIYLAITNKILTNNLQYVGGLLFGFTNFLIALSCSDKIDERCFGWFCFICSLCATSLGIYYLIQGNIIAGILWLVWMTIWLLSFFGYSINSKFKTITHSMFIIQGITTTLFLGFLILMDLVKIY